MKPAKGLSSRAGTATNLAGVIASLPRSGAFNPTGVGANDASGAGQHGTTLHYRDTIATASAL